MSTPTIGILACDHVDPALSDDAGGRDYADMYQQMLTRPDNEPNFRVYDAVAGELPADPAECDAWIITGARDDAHSDEPWVVALRSFIRHLATESARTVGVCFGHQVIAHALGGQSGRAGVWKVGPQALDVTATPWFDGGEVTVNAVHQDAVHELPPGARDIGTGPTAAHPMYLIGETILGIQDHPEFDARFVRAIVESRRGRLGDHTADAALNRLASRRTDNELIGGWLADFLLDRRLPPYGAAAIAEHTQSLAALAETNPLTTPVPTCGEWTLADLTWHLAEVQTFWAWAIENRPAGPTEYIEPVRPDDDQLSSLLRSTCDRLVQLLDAADPDHEAWSWSGDHTVRFTLRRQTHEALIHRMDGVLCTGADRPDVDPFTAADGVDELLTVMLSGVPDWATFERGADVLRLLATDAGREWTAVFGRMIGTHPDSGRSYDLVALDLDPSAAATATISTSAFTLDCWMWGRGELPTGAVSGNAQLANQLRDLVVDASQ